MSTHSPLGLPVGRSARPVALLAALSLAVWFAGEAGAQTRIITQPGGGVIEVAPGGGFTPGAVPNMQPGAQPMPQNQAGEEGQPKEEEGEKKEGEEKPPETVKRPSKPPRVPDPREFDAKLDDTERVEFVLAEA